MTMTPSVTVPVHCRLTVRVDPAAVTALAIQRLRSTDIDWADEEDDLETVAADLGADLLNSIAGLTDPGRLLADLPGAEVTGAHVWAEPADGLMRRTKNDRLQPDITKQKSPDDREGGR